MKYMAVLKNFWKRLVLHKWYVYGAAIVCVGAVFALILYANAVVNNVADGKLYNTVENVPPHNVGLLLGVNKYVADGRVNRFYTYRIDAAEALYESGKVRVILVSGDNGTRSYNEPQTMKEDLLERGIPEEDIVLDYAGFRTWDSVVRAKEVFGQDQITIISQPFHNTRALYIAEKNNIDAVGYNAQDVPVSLSPRVWLRERLARVAVIFDALRNAQPKFLGEQIYIEL